MRRRLDAAGYQEVKTPQLMDARQWERSGHWGKYRENMFVVPDEIPHVPEDGAEDEPQPSSGGVELRAERPGPVGPAAGGQRPSAVDLQHE